MISPGATPQYLTLATTPSMTRVHSAVVRMASAAAGTPFCCGVSFAPKPLPHNVHGVPIWVARPLHVRMAVPSANENAAGAAVDKAIIAALLVTPSLAT